MKKHQTEKIRKIRKIKAIPDRRIDFYYRLIKWSRAAKKKKEAKNSGGTCDSSISGSRTCAWCFKA